MFQSAAQKFEAVSEDGLREGCDGSKSPFEQSHTSTRSGIPRHLIFRLGHRLILKAYKPYVSIHAFEQSLRKLLGRKEPIDSSKILKPCILNPQHLNISPHPE